MAHLSAEIEVWGSVLYLEIASPIDNQGALSAGIERVREFTTHVDGVFSTYKENSTVSQLRRNEITIDQTSDEVRDVWRRCESARYLTDGAFDPWAIEGGFDPSGLVKGWAADRCALEGQSVSPWSIGVVNPEIRKEILQVFKITDGAIATSGTYERGAHIFDPHSGLIAIGAKSATVLGPDGAMADALATALMVEGRDGAMWFSQPELVQYSAWVIDRQEDIAWSVGPDIGQD
ncbi:MAG: FAD:protein FMN transferase [Actinobacteria bacterium]|nr:FAD:protein FMN transferase [Actinomycetota bacterium]